jgi:hypothetical protein
MSATSDAHPSRNASAGSEAITVESSACAASIEAVGVSFA